MGESIMPTHLIKKLESTVDRDYGRQPRQGIRGPVLARRAGEAEGLDVRLHGLVPGLL